MQVLDRPILVVDDSRVVRMVLTDLLGEFGFHDVRTAATAREAIDAYNTVRPGLVFLDITMPEIPGTRVARHILGADPYAKVVVVSAVSRDDDLVESVISEGVYEYIRKPVRREDIARLVARLADDEAVARRRSGSSVPVPDPMAGTAASGPERSSRKPLQDP